MTDVLDEKPDVIMDKYVEKAHSANMQTQSANIQTHSASIQTHRLSSVYRSATDTVTNVLESAKKAVIKFFTQNHRYLTLVHFHNLGSLTEIRPYRPSLSRHL